MLQGFDELLKNYNVGEFLPEELELLSNVQVLLALIESNTYLGGNYGVETAEIKVMRTSLAAAVLRHMKTVLNKLTIEE